MNSTIRIVVADNNFLSRKGLACLLGSAEGFDCVAEATNHEELLAKLSTFSPDVLVIDYSCDSFAPDVIAQVLKRFPDVHILAITGRQPRVIIGRALQAGVRSHLLRECDEEELFEALAKTAKGERFVCGQLLDTLTNDSSDSAVPVSCEGLNITDRELEIIALIAEGYSNKQIADRLCLSTHTVTTHRKNIMNKLQVNNTAGLVMFAVRNHLLGPNKFLFSSEN
jgi:two-component system response regulator NreC